MMQEPDRKLAWSAVLVLAVIAAEFAWLLFVGPTDHSNGAAAQHAADAQGGQDYPWWQYSGAWIAIFTVVLTGSTAALWFVTKRTLDHAQITSERELRAYVGVMSATRATVPDNADWPLVTLQYRNYGQTPAIDIAIWTAIKVAAVPNATPLERPPADVDIARDVLPPSRHSSITLTTNVPLTDEQKAAIGNGFAFYVWGEIAYRDIFGKAHTTKFRLFSASENYSGPTADRLGPCRDGNEAD